MMKEREYLEHKKQTIVNIVNAYNQVGENVKFKIDEGNLSIEKTFCSPEYCKDCGKCCKRFPCVYSPNDFLDLTDLDYMRRILDTGVVTIVNYNNDWPLIIRNRGINDSDNIACDDIDDYNQCLLHTEKGCMLPAVYRASNGLLFVKKRDRHIVLYGDSDYRADYYWMVYEKRKALKKLYDEYKDVVIPKRSINEERVNQFIKSLINKNT